MTSNTCFGRYSRGGALLAAALLLSVAAGCGDDSPSGGGGQGGSGAGGESAGGGSVVDPTPIVDRTPAISHACNELRPMTQPAGAMSTIVDGLVQVDGRFFVVETTDTVKLAEITLGGTWSAGVALDDTPFDGHQATAVAADGDIIAVWSQSSTGGLAIARVTPDMAIVTGPLEISGTNGTGGSVSALIPRADGTLTVLFGTSGNGGSGTSLEYLDLDADLVATGAAVEVDSFTEAYAATAAAVPTADGGLAVAYSANQEIRFAVLDSSGAPQLAPKRISRPATDGWSSAMEGTARANMVAVGDRYWVAFTERYAIQDTQMGHAIVRIAEVDADGNATLHALEAPVDQIEERWPTFVHVDDKIGLAWTKGTIIWICGGCISDYDMNFMLLDPAGMVPASERVTHVHTTNGIVAPMTAANGGDILDAAVLDFHALTLPASGAIHCASAP
ncbi:MAG: hypothetical protein U0271_35355 [Polyangiaceae bacterium]